MQNRMLGINVLQREDEMYAPLVEHFAARGFFVLREVHTHQGFVDVVAVDLDERGIEARLRSGITGAMLGSSLIRAWQALPPFPQAISLAEWAVSLAIQPNTIRGIARELERLELIEESSRVFRARIKLPRILRRVICCEAKLHAWHKGTRQAYGHRFYAHQSYLALAKISSAVDFELLNARQVGLLRVEPSQVTIQKEAPVLMPDDKLTLQQLEELTWDRLISNKTQNKRSSIQEFIPRARLALSS